MKQVIMSKVPVSQEILPAYNCWPEPDDADDHELSPHVTRFITT
jgi:hypothetical protein